MLTINYLRPPVQSTPIYDNDCDWTWQPSGEVDEYGDDIGDYVPDGSYPMTPWEEMLIRFAPTVCRLEHYPQPQCEYCDHPAMDGFRVCEPCAHEVGGLK